MQGVVVNALRWVVSFAETVESIVRAKTGYPPHPLPALWAPHISALLARGYIFIGKIL